MKIREFNKLEEIQKYYDKETNTYIFEEDGKNIDLVVFNFDLRINAHIKAYDIKACDIKAFNIQANGINAYDITAWNINAGDIDAFNINAVDINADDIKAKQIYARNINYYAVCVAYHDIICHSIEARREYHKHFVLDGAIKVLENGELRERLEMNSVEAFEEIIKVCNLYHQQITNAGDIESVSGYPIKKIKENLEILECFKKIPKQDLKEFIDWQIRYEKNLNTWLEGCNADLAKEDPTKHLIKIKEWLENDK